MKTEKSLPQRTGRSTLRYTLLVIVLMLTMFWRADDAHAAELEVECTNGVGDIASLITAIETANADPASEDSIRLGQNCTYTITGPYNAAGHALPLITGKTSIVGNGATLQLRSNFFEARLLWLAGTADVEIANLTLRDAVFSQGAGGAIYAEPGTVRLSLVAVTFLNNHASSGGAVAAASNDVAMVNSRFIGNRSSGFGGALYTPVSGTVSIQNSHFEDNRTTAGQGGGVWNSGSLSIVDTAFVDNLVVDIDGEFIRGGGLYTEGSAVIRNGSFTGNEALTLGVKGQGGAIYAANRLELNGTTFDDNRASFAGGAVHVLDVFNGNGLTFTNNGEEAADSVLRGGAIYSNGSIFLRESNFTGNKAGFGGALVQANSDKAVVVQNSTFQNNSARDSGALSSSGPLTLIQGQILDNRALDRCGGIKISNDAAIRNSSFMRNITEDEHGGAACLEGGTTQISESQFLFNQATSATAPDSTMGGAIYASNETTRLDITENTFQGNEATLFGGAIASFAIQTNIDQSVFAHNKALRRPESTTPRSTSGGAVYLAAAAIGSSHFENNQADQGGAIYTKNDFLIERSKFIVNKADAGGGLYADKLNNADEGTYTTQNNLWIGNEGRSVGAAAYIDRFEGTQDTITMRHETIVHPDDLPAADNAIFVVAAKLDLANSIISNYGTAIDLAGGNLHSNHNIYFGNDVDIEEQAEQINDLTIDPLFVNPNIENYQLQPNSPAINSGTDQGVTEDHAGNPRPHGAGFDRGAFEYQGDDPVPTATPVTPTATPVPPTEVPTEVPTDGPTANPTVTPPATEQPSETPIATSEPPTATPSATPSATEQPGDAPTAGPTATSTAVPTATNTSVPDEPISGLTASNSSPTVFGNGTTFSVSVASGTNVAYTWDFGDGSNSRRSAAEPSHAYPPGTYTARVTARNSVSEATAETVVTINPAPAEDAPITNLFALFSGDTRVNGAINFVATVDSGSGIAYTWDFGDGTSATGPVPSHVYAEAGSYTVRVLATNSLGSDESEMTINIEALPDSPPDGTDGLTEGVFLPFISQ